MVWPWARHGWLLSVITAVTASASLPALPAGTWGHAGTRLYVLPPPPRTFQTLQAPAIATAWQRSLKHTQLWGHPCRQPGTPRVLTETVRQDREGGKKRLLQTHGFWRLFKANCLSLGCSSKVQDPAGRRLLHSSALCLGKINRKESSSGAFLLLCEMDWHSPPQENCPTMI